MERMQLANRIYTVRKPGQPGFSRFFGKEPVTEKRIGDPSSTSPKGERYPIPSFFEYRICPKDFDMF